MRIALYSRSENPSLGLLTSLLGEMGIEYVENPCMTSGFDFAVSFGGDGTFLSSVRKMGHDLIPILGINSGRLGFLASVSKEKMKEAIEMLAAGEYELERRTMIKIETNHPPENIPHRALNEFTLQKTGTAMISVDVVIDGHKVGNYWSDGVIVSTPTGSTAYSMSVGGAIVTPTCGVFILSPIAPHNLNIRPLVISDTSQVQLMVSTRMGHDAIATVDNREFAVPSGTVFELHRSKYKLEIIKLKGSSFYRTIREKLFWGVDLRS